MKTTEASEPSEQEQIIKKDKEENIPPEKITTTATATATSILTKTTAPLSTAASSSSKVYVPAYELLTRREKRLVYGALCCGMFLAALDQLIVAVSLPTIINDLGGEKYLSWVIAAYLLTSSAAMPLYGKYSDIYGRRIVYEFALVWFFIGSFVCGFASNIAILIAARAIQGIGGGGLMSLTMVLIGDIAKPAVRAKYMGSISGIFGLATVVGPVLGGFFTTYISWRWIFFINIPFTGITTIVVWIILAKIKNGQKDLQVDILGSFLVVAGSVCLALVVTWGGETYAWDSWICILLMVASVILFVLFVFQELRHEQPIIKFPLMKIRNFGISCIVMFVFGMSMLGAFSFVPFYFQYVRGDSSLIAGLKIFPLVIGTVAGSAITGGVISKTGKYIAFPTMGLAVLSLGQGLLMLMSVKLNFWIEAVFLLVVGLGMGLTFPVYNSIVQNSVPPQDMASSIGALSFIRQIGGSIGVSILGSIYSQQTSLYYNRTLDLQRAQSKALHDVFLAALIPAFIGFLFAFGIQNVPLFQRQTKPKISVNDGIANREAVTSVDVSQTGTQSKPQINDKESQGDTSVDVSIVEATLKPQINKDGNTSHEDESFIHIAVL